MGGLVDRFESLRLPAQRRGHQHISDDPTELAEHYREKELGEGCGKTKLTGDVYAHYLKSYILPRWGDER